MHTKGDNNWLYNNIGYGSSSTLSKNNFRHTLQYSDYNIMPNRSQPTLKNDQYSNYYNNLTATQNNTAYSNNYSNYGCVNNQQQMQSSQPVWGFRQTPYCFGTSCASYTNVPNNAPVKQMQYPHGAYERSSISHNFAQFENPVIDSFNQMSNYPPRYNQQGNYENTHANNPKVVHKNKRYVTETSKIHVRNIFELNNAVCNETNTNIEQTTNKTSQLNCYLGYLSGQNESCMIPPIKQHENVSQPQGNFRPFKPEQQQPMRAVANVSVTKMCQNASNINPLNINQNNSCSYQKNVPKRSNVDKTGKEKNVPTFPERVNVENIYSKRPSCIQENLNSEKQNKTQTLAVDQANILTQENTTKVVEVPEKSPPFQKNVNDLTDVEIEESVFFSKKPGPKSRTMKKALLATKNRILEFHQTGSNSSQSVNEMEDEGIEQIMIKEEKNPLLPEKSQCYTVETCVIEDDSINEEQQKDLYIIKSKFESKIDRKKLQTLMGFLASDSYSYKSGNFKEDLNSEDNSSSTCERIQFESNHNKRKHEEDDLKKDKKKISKTASVVTVPLTSVKNPETEDIENLKSIVLKECGLEPELELEVEPEPKGNSDSLSEGKITSLRVENEEKKLTETKGNDADDNSSGVLKELNSSPAKVVVETETKKKRPSKRMSTDTSNEKNRMEVESENKSTTKDAGVTITSDFDDDSIIKTMKAFQSLKFHKCMSCDLTFPSNNFWINVITGELRCLNCFKKMVKKTEESLK